MPNFEPTLARKVPELSGLEIGQEATCFAALSSKQVKIARTGSPYAICTFKDRYGTKDFFIWSTDPLHDDSASWRKDTAYRLRVRSKSSQRGVELSLIEARLADPELDKAEGFDESDLYELSRFDLDHSFQTVRNLASETIEDPCLLELVTKILDHYQNDLKRQPAASFMHHAFTGGLIEHLRSMTRVSVWLGRHYAKYYSDLDPPINLGIIAATAILHDLGKVIELQYSPIAATYTTQGRLIGHILIGRDIIREVAATIDDFPPELLMQLEHAVLAHHGKLEYGSPVLPQTIEAYIVSIADDLDAKINQIARARMTPPGLDEFTEDINFGDGRRRFYRGKPLPPPAPAPQAPTSPRQEENGHP